MLKMRFTLPANEDMEEVYEEGVDENEEEEEFIYIQTKKNPSQK